MVRKMLFAATLASLALSATACNTVKGAGRDLQSAAQSTQDAINGR